MPYFLLCFTGIKVGFSIYKKLGKVENRKELLNSLIYALGDGKITKVEWGKLGDKLGVFDESV